MDAKAVARQIARFGGDKDRVLAHISPAEAALLARMNGGRINPVTGLPQFGWLQDLSSEFSIRRPLQLIEDPHKFFTTEATKSFQSHVGPELLNFVPVVGPLLSAGAKEWLSNEASKGTYGGKTNQTPIQENPGLGAGVGGFLGGIAGSYFGSPKLGSLIGGKLGSGFDNNSLPTAGGIGSPNAQIAEQAAATGSSGATGSSSSAGLGSLAGLLGGSGSAAKTTPASGGSTAQLQTQIAQLKQEIESHYAAQGASNDPQKAQDLAAVDAFAAQMAAQDKQAQSQSATVQQQLSAPVSGGDGT